VLLPHETLIKSVKSIPVKITLQTVSIVLGISLFLGGVGCHKNAAATNAPKSLEEGIADLRAALVTANPVVQSNFYHGVSSYIRYAKYGEASSALEQMIASDPSLNDQQKKAINEVDDLLKQAMANQQNPAQPAK